MAPRKKNAVTDKKGKKEKKSIPGGNKNHLPVLPSKITDEAFYIVGMGASAGGLEAFETFFKHTPKEPGMAFVIVTHLDLNHNSMLGELLQRHTDMQVHQIEDGMKCLPNMVFVSPPNKEVAILQRTFKLIDPIEKHASRTPINYFLRTLAQDQGDWAICIIFSGMGTDGTLGLRDIKGELGMTMVQDLNSAKYPGMPSSAINTGLTDYILPVENMPDQLSSYTRYAAKNNKTSRIIISEDKIPDVLQKIFILLRSQTEHDFSNYKPTSISRRIERRMNIHQIDSLSYYFSYLQRNPQEIVSLFKELLIGVTSFFRDPEAYKALKRKVLLDAIKAKPADQTLRVWVVGCSTGEEAYSIAILVRECLEELNHHLHVQIFGTDIDNDSIYIARTGAYPESIAADVDGSRLQRFFQKSDSGGYIIKKESREMLIFAPQNVIMDPPFTKLDMICCRNLLIYLNSALQKKILPLFHYSLIPQGVLFLGTSETIGGNENLFSVIDSKWKIYRRNETASVKLISDFPLTIPPDTGMIETRKDIPAETSINQLALRLVADLVPPSVLIDSKGDILYIHGRTGNFLEPTPGEAKMNLLEMAREGLKNDISVAIRRAIAEKRELVQTGLTVKTNGDSRMVSIRIKPVKDERTLGLFWVMFEDEYPLKNMKDAASKGSDKTKKNKRMASIEDELRYTQETLQTTIEELETSNEELKSTNEELQSTNEELQSANEELETSREEQQSLNEELITVNSELYGKVEALEKINNDMRNLLDSIDVPTIFLDTNLHITRYTNHATKLFHIIESDIGRSIGHIASKLKQENFEEDAAMVLKHLIPIEKECESKEGRFFLLRLLPYRTQENIIEGVVITFMDIHEQKTALLKVKELNKSLQDAHRYSENIVETLREAILVLNSELKIMLANRSFYRIFQMAPEAVLGRFIYDLGNKQWDIPALRELLEKIIPSDNVIENYEITCDFPKIGLTTVFLNARRMVQKYNNEELILLAMENTPA